ncbi:Anthranilate synthase component 1 [uncultured archaeon]|nr:Anthranilate synthase component 1 [uncultured archaeon]
MGADPSAMVTVKNRYLTMEFFSGGMDPTMERLSKCVDVEKKGTVLQGPIKGGYDLFDALRSAIPCSRGMPNSFGRQVFTGGGIGYLAYDLVAERLGKSSKSEAPDAQFSLAESTFIFDHLTRKVYFTIAPILPGPKVNLIETIGGIDPDYDQAEDLDTKGRILTAGDMHQYQDSVLKAKVHIKDGDIFQIVLARSARIECPDPLKLYRKLRSINPSPYTYLFEFGELAIVGASPETLFNTYNRQLKVNPIAGTCPRGRTRAEDDRYAKIMLGDEKERAEHVMLVDLGRNDVRSVCRSGTVQVEDFMSVLKYSHVQHIETTVIGNQREESDKFDAARAVFPAGTLSGAPKLRAMEIIDDLEPDPRGIYGGGIGYFSIDGSTDFAIAIRSVLVKDGVATVQAGAGIVADSDPQKEYQETERKMAAMKRALGVVV